MEKPSTFHIAAWILYVCAVLGAIISFFVIHFDDTITAYQPPWYGILWESIVIIVLFGWFCLQIKKAKDWARISSLFYLFISIGQIMYRTFFETESPIYHVPSNTAVWFYSFLILLAFKIYAHYLLFTKKSNQYIRFHYSIKQDLKNKNLK